MIFFKYLMHIKRKNKKGTFMKLYQLCICILSLAFGTNIVCLETERLADYTNHSDLLDKHLNEDKQLKNKHDRQEAKFTNERLDLEDQEKDRDMRHDINVKDKRKNFNKRYKQFQDNIQIETDNQNKRHATELEQAKTAKQNKADEATNATKATKSVSSEFTSMIDTSSKEKSTSISQQEAKLIRNIQFNKDYPTSLGRNLNEAVQGSYTEAVKEILQINPEKIPTQDIERAFKTAFNKNNNTVMNMLIDADVIKPSKMLDGEINQRIKDRIEKNKSQAKDTTKASNKKSEPEVQQKTENKSDASNKTDTTKSSNKSSDQKQITKVRSEVEQDIQQIHDQKARDAVKELVEAIPSKSQESTQKELTMWEKFLAWLSSWNITKA